MNMMQFKEQLFIDGKIQGFEDMELYFERAENFSCEWFEGEVDSYETSEILGVAFRGKFNGKLGTAYTEKLDRQSIAFLLKEAMENSMYIEEEPEEIFIGSEEYANISFYTDSLKAVSIQEKINLLKEIEEEILQIDKRITSIDGLSITSADIERTLVNSKGLTLQEKQNYIGIYVSVVAKQGEEIKTGSYSAIVKDFFSINVKKIAQKAVEEAIAQLGGKSAENKSYRVLLRHDAASSLFNTFSQIFSAEKIQKGQSLLKGQIGEVIAAPNVTIVDEPHLKDGLYSRTFDGEGVATKKHTLVDKGKLLSVLHNQLTAKKEGCLSTGHAYRPSYKSSLAIAPTNLYIEPKEKSYDELVSQMEEGIIIIDLAGLHSGADPVSGDFSVAANGLYVKDGKIKMPLNLMTVAGNFFELLKDIEEVGSDLHFAPYFVSPGNIGSPSLLIKNLSITIE